MATRGLGSEMNREFLNLYRHGYVRIALGTPLVRVADPDFNAAQTISLLEQAATARAVVAVFPELGLSGYTCDDLFHQSALLDGCVRALAHIRDASRQIATVCIVGAPLRIDDAVFNCAVVVHRGRVLGVVPKTYLPNYREFYEARYFAPAEAAVSREVELVGQDEVPFGNALLFRHEEQPLLRFHVEICEDLWVPIPPSSFAAMAGATVLVNVSASNITIGKSEFRHRLVSDQSARCIAAYVYTAAGQGESTTDLAWDGQALAYENGTLIAESRRFALEPQLTMAEVDLDRLIQDRLRQNSFSACTRTHAPQMSSFRNIPYSEPLPQTERLLLSRPVERFPYVPSDPDARGRRCEEVYSIQAQGLATRLRAAGVKRVVVGVSGGLDSAQALIVSARAMDLIGEPRSNVLGYSLPGFATGTRTRRQALELMKALGCTTAEIDIRPGSERELADIGHPYASGEKLFDVTFENVQAGTRTSRLFRLANMHSALVVGSSDLSELALGWCTYGVGDHMAHYHVNASVPKTLIQYLLRWVADTQQLGAAASDVLRDILATEISPELVPSVAGAAGQPSQLTEASVGPYELQDFHLYYTLRFGHRPSKVAFLAYCAWHDRASGTWPEIPHASRHEYGLGQIKFWLGVFLRRFFQGSQFKRSCIANAPKVGSGGSLSPRGDWRAPSDGSAEAWLAELAEIPGEEG